MHSPMQASRPQPAMDEKPENFPAPSQERCADRHPFEGHVSAPHKEMTMLQTKAFDYQQQIPAIVKAMVGAETAIGDHGLDPKLRHLVKLRASQINGGAFCAKVNTDRKTTVWGKRV